ncbi:MAG: cytochrome c3 family protein [Nitrospiraceae bacterium]|nr:cytochrome c3 family protein [Nitrospiraceae bacterium]
MRNKYIIFGFISTLIVVVFLALDARYAAATVVGGKHDLSFSGSANFQYATDEPCIFCHTPHAANVNTVYSTDPASSSNTGSGNSAPGGQFLWNRALPQRTWNVYSSSTLNANTSGGPGTLSLLCLSCHDGVGAMNVLLNYASGQPASMGFLQNQFGDFSTSDPNIGPLNIGGGQCDGGAGTGCVGGGGDLQNDHPIGFVYDNALATADGGLNPPASLNTALKSRMTVTGNRMECSTCHDPHITNLGGNAFLVMSNTGSALCLQCHNK